MTQGSAEARLRRTLRLGAAAIFVVTPLELVFTEHHGSTIQLLPFVAAALGVTAVLMLHLRGPGRLASALLVLVSLVGALGMWEHFEHNYAFEREIHPNLGATAAARSAFFGAGPALAPGILLLGAALGWASVRD